MSRMRATRRMMYEELLCEETLKWQDERPKRDKDLQKYTFRQGVSHLIQRKRGEEGVGLLSHFPYVMKRLQVLANTQKKKKDDKENEEAQYSQEASGLGKDWRRIKKYSVPYRDKLASKHWEAFVRKRLHILRRGNEDWPAYKILLQLAVEHADDSEVTQQAEAWLEADNCTWEWLRNPQRLPHFQDSGIQAVFEGHTNRIRGALLVDSEWLLSWGDETLRLWSLESGECINTLQGHTKWVRGAVLCL